MLGISVEDDNKARIVIQLENGEQIILYAKKAKGKTRVLIQADRKHKVHREYNHGNGVWDSKKPNDREAWHTRKERPTAKTRNDSPLYRHS